MACGLPIRTAMISRRRRDTDSRPTTDRFFDLHLAGVRARLDAQARKAIQRQHEAWREQLHREALLDGKDFKPADAD